MSHISSFRMGKGVTQKIPGTDYEFTRKYLEVEVKLADQAKDEDFHEAVIHAEYLIDSWIQAPEVEAAKIPTVDIGEINSLVWMSYKTKQPCTKPDEPGWIFSSAERHPPDSQKAVQKLAEAIEKAPQNKLELGNVQYTFSGPKEDPKLFISRRPAAKK